MRRLLCIEFVYMYSLYLVNFLKPKLLITYTLFIYYNNTLMAANTPLARRKILITGVTGYLGSHIADLLLKIHPQVQIIGTTRSLKNT